MTTRTKKLKGKADAFDKPKANPAPPSLTSRKSHHTHFEATRLPLS
jgi:hypothetical protein